ncbi:MAG TPA: PQQ-dependent sugar dehydrogenase, partial [Rhodothermales bacterium]
MTTTTRVDGKQGWGTRLLAFALTLAATAPAAAQTEMTLEVVAQGLAAPLAAVEAPDDSGRLFIVDQIGQIRIVDADGTLLPAPFLDVGSLIVNLNGNFDERGLLGLAFHPDFATNGRFFVYYSAPRRAGAPAGYDHTSTISEFSVSESDANLADLSSEKVLLQIDQPQSNHNAGAIAIGPDGHVYFALGDGGGANDTDFGHAADWYASNAGGNGQDVTDNLLGSILRIDVDNGDPYGIPVDNPFADNEGLDEVYAYGLRNPYRFSFDMGGDNDLIVADVGQGRWEEVNVVELGGNYGWNVYEGAHCFSASSPSSNPTGCPTTVGAGHPDEGAPMLDPVLEYRNPDVGVAVVGGFVYRGTAMPELEGQYVFGDWIRGTGTLFIATPSDTGPWT